MVTFLEVCKLGNCMGKGNKKITQSFTEALGSTANMVLMKLSALNFAFIMKESIFLPA